ncbi:MAG: hypothetical protein ABI192_04055, partial [Bradyrhizobium sp.]
YRYTIPQELPCKINGLYCLRGGIRLRRRDSVTNPPGWRRSTVQPGPWQARADALVGVESREAAAILRRWGRRSQDRGK